MLSSGDVIEQVRSVTYIRLKDLGVSRDVSKCCSKLPRRGSNDIDIQSFVVWVNKVQATDKSAIEQLVAIDATVVARTG
jgi:hypothetical protein